MLAGIFIHSNHIQPPLIRMPSPKGPPEGSRSPPVATAVIVPLTEPEPTKQLSTRVPANTSAPDDASSKPKGRLPTALVRINRRLDSKLEILFASLGALTFVSLEFYLFISNCTTNETYDFLIKGFSLMGIVVSVFVILNNSFDERAIIGRGAVGFFIFFIISGIIIANALGAYWAMDCMCKCPATSNAFISETSHDLVIFLLEILGLTSLIAILMVAATLRN